MNLYGGYGIMLLMDYKKMIKDLINKFKTQREELTRVYPSNEEKLFDESTTILVSDMGNYFKMDIHDYMDIGLYSDIIDTVDPNKMNNKISMGILWNSAKQKVNKGTFYVICHENNTYNILINNEEVKLDQRIKLEDEIHEEIISVNLTSNDFHFTALKHDNVGSTFYTKNYHPDDVLISELAFSKEEAHLELTKLFDSFSSIDNIDTLIDLKLIKDIVLRDLRLNEIKREYRNL